MSKVKNLFRNIWNVIGRIGYVIGFVLGCVLVPFVLGQFILSILTLRYRVYKLHLPMEECASKYADLYNKRYNRFGLYVEKGSIKDYLVEHQKHH